MMTIKDIPKNSMTKTPQRIRMLVYFRNQGLSSRFFRKQHQETYDPMHPMQVQDKDPTMYLRDMDLMGVNKEDLLGRDKAPKLVSHRRFQREVIRVQSDRNIQDNLKFQGIPFL
jgi:hypothetical protein